jgi:hypothetical protein
LSLDPRSGTYLNQQWPPNAEPPADGSFMNTLSQQPNQAIRIWMEVGDKDSLITRDNMRDWVVANENMARVLAR